MNTHKLLVSILMIVSILLSACAPAPTAVPPTAVPTVVPTFDVSVTPPAAKVIAEWKVNSPGDISIGFNTVWIPGHHDFITTRIDPASNKVTAVIKGTGDHSEQALAVGDVLWVTGQHDDTTWIDPKTNAVTTTVPRVDGHFHHIAYGFNSLWATTSDNKLDRIDPATSAIIASIQYAHGYADCVGFVVATTAAVWVEECDTVELIKVDPATNSIVSKTPWTTLIDEAKAQTTVPAGKGTDFIWINIFPNQIKSDNGISVGLLRVDPMTGTGVTFLALDSKQIGSIAVGDYSIWIAGDGQINRVNVATNQIDAAYTTDPGAIQGIVIGFGSIWLANYDKAIVQRLDIAP